MRIARGGGAGSATVRASFLCLLVAARADGAEAGEFRSGFGFGMSVPDVWLVIDRGAVERELALAGDFAEGTGGVLARIPEATLDAVFERVRAGELEVLYRRERTSEVFVDNVNLVLQPLGLPKTLDQLAGVCRALPREFSRLFGRPIAMENCEMRERARLPALYLQFEGATPGTTTMQYQLPRFSGETLVITATTIDAGVPRMLDELEGMVDSIRLEAKHRAHSPVATARADAGRAAN